MIIESQRFGAIELIPTEVFTLLNGLPEHPMYHHFAWLQNSADQAGAWLQSADNPALAIRLMNPLVCVPGYQFTIRREVQLLLAADHPRQIAVYVPLTNIGRSMNARLDRPLLIHPAKRRGVYVSLPAMPEIEDLVKSGTVPSQPTLHSGVAVSAARRVGMREPSVPAGAVKLVE